MGSQVSHETRIEDGIDDRRANFLRKNPEPFGRPSVSETHRAALTTVSKVKVFK